jgi:hypothetical protein
MIAPEAGNRWPVRRLWSLLDMLRIFAEKYIQLGARIDEARNLFEQFSIEVEGKSIFGLSPKENDEARETALREVLTRLTEVCASLDLPVSSVLIADKIEFLPRTQAEFDILIHSVIIELKTRLFLFVPPHAARYYELDSILSERTKERFPSASAEIRAAATCFALDQHTAAVFHAMRAAEIGIRALADDAELKLKHDVSLADWQEIQRGVQDKIGEIGKRPRSKERDTDLEFYSQAGA